MDENAPEWGMALMNLQAYRLDNRNRENVMMALFGDVQVHANLPSPEINATINADSPINVRNEPSI